MHDSLKAHRPGQRRAVITGLGIVAPNGSTLERFWSSVLDGRVSVGRVTRFDPTPFPNAYGCEVRDYDPGLYIEAKQLKRTNLGIQFAVGAAKCAIADSGLDLASLDPDRVGLVEGTSVTGMDSWLSEHVGFLERGYRAISPFTLINAHSGSGSGELALELGVRGHAISFSTGSASGNDVIGFGLRTIRSDEVDVMVVGGTEAPILAPLWGAFGFAKVMSGRASDSNPAMRPFDKSRDGFLLGEGSAFVVMEELAHALGRGARIYAEVAGHGRTCEAYHSVAPHPDGLGLARAVEKALRDADVDQDDIEYVNTHGTATHLNDTAEAKALTAVFQRPVAVSSTKPVTGHLLAAAGALETVVCALALRYQVIPHTVNLADPIEETRNLDMVMHAPRPYPLRVVANTSVGFGGKNSCLILRSIDA